MASNNERDPDKTFPPNLIVTASGPGELEGWVRPIVREIRRQKRPWRVSLILWKTSFSAGTEKRIHALIPELDGVHIQPGNLKASFNRAAFSQLVQTACPKALLHLGGGMIDSLILAKRLGCPAFLYSEGASLWQSIFFQKVFVPGFESERPGLFDSAWGKRYETVGNLFADAMAGRHSKFHFPEPGRQNKSVTIGFFPGSRPYQVRYMAPLLLLLSRRIAREVPHVEFLFAKSDYISEHEFRKLVATKKSYFRLDRKTADLPQKASSKAEKALIDIIPIMSSREVLAESDMAVMLPGTVTAEGMISGVPMVILAPYYRLGSNPSVGVPPAMDAILGMLNERIKQKVLLCVLKRLPFLSHPNRKARREIVPELRGWIRPHCVVETISTMARNESLRSRIARDLLKLSGPAGAAEKIVTALDPFMH